MKKDLGSTIDPAEVSRDDQLGVQAVLCELIETSAETGQSNVAFIHCCSIISTTQGAQYI
jgi:hypothetical protein